MSNKKKILVLFLSLMVLFCFLTIYTIKSHPKYFNKFKYYVKERIITDRSNTVNYISKLRNDSYSLHRKAAKSGDVFLIKDNNNITQFLKKGILVKVEKDTGFRINKLIYSKAVLSKKSYQMLKKIGINFDDKVYRNQYFTVTSLTRTVESQKNLAKSNLNATKNISTHSYGASFDISYTRFNGNRGRNNKLQKILEEILILYQKEKKIYVLKEKKSNCYHVTVR